MEHGHVQVYVIITANFPVADLVQSVTKPVSAGSRINNYRLPIKVFSFFQFQFF